MTEIDVLRIDSQGRKNIKDIVTEEVPLTIYLNDQELLTLLCSPDNLKQLCTGFLYSSGLIKATNEIKKVTIDRQRWVAYVQLNRKDQDTQVMFKRLYTSGCGRGTIFYNTLDLMHKKRLTSDGRIAASQIVTLMDTFQKSSLTFQQTGGVHCAALSDGEKILIFKEDIGRHNALDKVIGAALIQELNLADLVVLVSGRISSEIVSKVQKTKAAFVISRSAPTEQAVNLAKEVNLTLIGFARGKRMNIYTARERVI